jgi:predicted 2-oxoglutarate/Fe(II)-dependent dioxygenase YbiX
MSEEIIDIVSQSDPETSAKKSDLQIYEFEDFLDPSICDHIVMWFKTTPKVKKNGGNSLFNERQIDYANISDPQVRKLVNAFKFDAAFFARKCFNESHLYPDYTDLVLWDEGTGMVVHADNSYQDGTPNYCSWRKYSGVLYLNDEFLGGETFFPDLGPLFIKPKKGKFVVYPSNLEYSHGITTVVGGKRYTMPIWFTDQHQYIET